VYKKWMKEKSSGAKGPEQKVNCVLKQKSRRVENKNL
jgi:hypothetical protein